MCIMYLTYLSKSRLFTLIRGLVYVHIGKTQEYSLVAKYSDFGLSEAVSRKRCKIGGKLVLITNRKSYMSFRLVPKSVILNDLERRNGLYFALFHRIRVASAAHCVEEVEGVVAKQFTFAISSPDELVVTFDVANGDVRGGDVSVDCERAWKS